MGYALFVIRKEGTRAKVGPSTAVFCLQLALNGAWPWLFFAKHLMFVSVTEIWVLVIAIFLTIGLTWKVSGKAVAILIPYLVWMIYAAVLTTSIWNLNPAPPLEGPGQNQNITITVALQSARTTLLS
jgi:tryptophan-rich sensory protein